MHQDLPLRGRTALVTGVSRRRGIRFAVAAKFARLGASVLLHHFRPHDLGQPWGGDDLDAVVGEIRRVVTDGAVVGDVEADLRDPDAIARVVDAGVALTGRLDILVCNQAKSGGDGSILDLSADAVDAHWETNARATLLLTAEFARRLGGHAPERARPGDRIERQGPCRDRSKMSTCAVATEATAQGKCPPRWSPSTGGPVLFSRGQ